MDSMVRRSPPCSDGDPSRLVQERLRSQSQIGRSYFSTQVVVEIRRRSRRAAPRSGNCCNACRSVGKLLLLVNLIFVAGGLLPCEGDPSRYTSTLIFPYHYDVFRIFQSSKIIILCYRVFSYMSQSPKIFFGTIICRDRLVLCRLEID